MLAHFVCNLFRFHAREFSAESKTLEPEKNIALVLVYIVGTYVELLYLEKLILKKCQKFEGVLCTLWSVIVTSNILKDLPYVPCVLELFEIKTYFKATAATKQQRK